METLQLLAPKLLLALEPLEDYQAVQLETPETQGSVQTNMTIHTPKLEVLVGKPLKVQHLLGPLKHLEVLRAQYQVPMMQVYHNLPYLNCTRY